MNKTKICDVAARKGRLVVLEWLVGPGQCPWDRETVVCNAALGGHVCVLRWAKGQGCAFDERTLMFAAQGGSLEAIKWLRSQDCPWDEKAGAAASRAGHNQVLRWLQAHGCPQYDELAASCGRWS